MQPPQDARDGSHRRQLSLQRQPLREKLPDFLRTPCRVLLSQTDDFERRLRRRAVRNRFRPVRAVDESVEPALMEALQPLVAGLAADIELAAQLAKRNLFSQCLQDEF